MSDMPLILAIILFAYLCGSIPFGLILTRMAGLGDIRSIGSGNIGATNVLRTGNKKIAAAVLLLDGLKGYAAVVVTYQLFYWKAVADAPDGFDHGWEDILFDQALPYMLLAGLCAVLGHLFPVWLKFKGGKGVATAIGTYFGISLISGGIVIAIWLIVFAISRISSLSALTAFFLMTLMLGSATLVQYGQPDYLTVYAFVIMLLIFWRHKENIKRLRSGTELKFGSKK